MKNTLETLAQSALQAALEAGADSADVITLEGRSVSLDMREGKLEQAERAEGTDLGLRVMVGQRQAMVSSSDTRPEALLQVAGRAVAMAREAPEDPYIGLASPDQLATSWDIKALELYDDTPEPSPEVLQDDARRAEAAALANTRISQVQSASASYSQTSVHLVTSTGFSGGYQRSSRSLSCVAIAGTGLHMERDYDGDGRIFQADLRSPEEIGALAASRAVERLNPRKPKTGSYPVIFDERVSSTLLGHLLAAVNGAMVARGSSWLRDALGEQVLPPHLSIVEDPHRPRTSASRPFDAEGLPTAPRHIIRDGVLEGWTLDLANARKLGLTSTANAARGTGSAPSPSVWNVALTQGAQTRAELLRNMGTGFLVTSLIGSTINPNTGDYSRGASGFWVENGEVVHAVNEVTIAGNLRDMLRTIIPANDARTHLSRVVPSLLVEGLTLAGS
ncbi:TldD/PmbA family protein [Lentibacter sp. XHP0401]|uniref:TldD/PmbA family protein n=1 Tax=Lentibacter sp. XHP0401 TaxID=2984334 RepID=UPI0021E8AE87|nr:TldD/PmbA family protein [Lentibacter sp. XHP0401]MCV2892667.1 TldD/PmbA family protein [Lentibacter sp. XHP0401]